MDEPVPDHSTLSQLRRRKFKGTNLFEEIFDEIVRKCIDVGLVTGSLLCTDSTHVRANARNDLRETIEVEDKPSKYIQRLDEEAINNGLIKPKKARSFKMKKVIKSITDPDSGVLSRPGKPTGFYYLNYQTCDGNSGIITDVFVTSASTPFTVLLSICIDK